MLRANQNDKHATAMLVKIQQYVDGLTWIVIKLDSQKCNCSVPVVEFKPAFFRISWFYVC